MTTMTESYCPSVAPVTTSMAADDIFTAATAAAAAVAADAGVSA